MRHGHCVPFKQRKHSLVWLMQLGKFCDCSFVTELLWSHKKIVETCMTAESFRFHYSSRQRDERHGVGHEQRIGDPGS